MTAAEVYLESYARGWKPDPVLTVSEWADEHRFLSSAVSSEPGPWRTSRVPYLREIMDCMSATHPARRIVFMKGSRVGATEAINNAIGYWIHHAPGPILFVQPTDTMAKDESKTRVAPMIEDSEVLRQLVADPKTRDSGNTILLKEFPGGLLRMVGANSKNAFRRVSARYLPLDEVDAYPYDVQQEGDPIQLAEQRTSNFPRRKVVITSTPTVQGLSRIEREWKRSDQRRYYVPCPHCGHMDFLTWDGIDRVSKEPGTHFKVVWNEGEVENAGILCPSCDKRIQERYKPLMLAQGEWRPTRESSGRTAGFHLSALYAPLGWKSWGDCVSEFLDSKEDPSKLKAWVNTILGETWEERGDSVDAEGLAARLETYPNGVEVPNGVGILVASVDVQGDRLEAQVKGYGAGEESWLIAYHQEHGDPIHQETWLGVDKFLTQEFKHQSGRKLKVECVAVDSGGHHTEEVYKFCRARLHRRVFAIRGGNERGKPVVPERPSIRNRYRTKLFTLCTDTAKEIIMSRLRIGSPGPGYVHLPDWVDAEYLAQLTAEKSIRKYVKGKGSVREWVKMRERNEALDLEVYCLAALYILGRPLVRSLPERAAALAEPLEEGEEPAKVAKPRRRRRSWVSGWKT